MKTEYSSENVRCIYDQDEQGFEHRLLVVQNGFVELIEEPRFQVLRIGLHRGDRHDHDVYLKFTAASGDWSRHAIEVMHPEPKGLAERLQDFAGILRFPVSGVKPYLQPGIDWHMRYAVMPLERAIRIVPDGPAPIHDVIQDKDGLYGLLREIVRGTRLRVATIQQTNEWVAGVFRVWDDYYMGNNDVGFGATEAEALQKLDERIKERLESASRTVNFTPVERDVFAEFHKNWVTPEPTGEWSNG